MIGWLTMVVIAIAVVTAIWGAVSAIIGRPAGNLLFYCSFLATLAVLVQSVVGFVAIADGHGPDELATGIAYLIGILLLMPAAIWWALSDRSRFSGLVMSVAGIGIAVMSLRLLELWGGLGA
jgi:hypothetical protein